MHSNANVTIAAMGINQLVFGWIDYCLFGGLLGVSLLIGVYFGFFSKQDSASEYLFGGKTINYVPIATSILARLVIGSDDYFRSRYMTFMTKCCFLLEEAL